MTLSMIDQSIQSLAWLIAIIELILGLYVLVLNAWDRTNRHASAILLLVGINTFVVGWMIGVENLQQAHFPALLLAITSPSIQPLLFVAIIAIVKPEWLISRNRWTGWMFYTLTIIPIAFTLYDQFFANPLWYSGLPFNYTGGFIPLGEVTQGLIADRIRFVSFTLLPALALLLLLYFAIFDKRVLGGNRRLAWLLLIAQAASYMTAKVLSPQLLPAVAAMASSTLFITVFVYAFFLQILSERRIQRGSLQFRLTASIMVVAIPLLIAITVFVNWRASSLINWGATTQLSESELLAGEMLFQHTSLISLAIGVMLLVLISWLTIRYALQPLIDLSNTANGVASGDLTRVAVVQTEDELGDLARAYNSMITQVRETITSLQRRVAERDRDLERRTIQLQLSAEVARQSSANSGLDQLLDRLVRLISDRFNIYHAGIFLIDEEGDHLVLRAASSPGGKRLVERNFKQAIDQTSLVGSVADKGELLLSQDIDKDTLAIGHADLPQTRSEIALPLKTSDLTLGVLDLQASKIAAFSNDDIEIFEILSDQIALAIDRAKLQTKNEELSREMGLLYQQQIHQSWQRRLEDLSMTFAYRSGNVTREFSHDAIEKCEEQTAHLLKLPVILRDQSLGWVTLRRHHEGQPWSEEETDLVKETLTQIALALENARLLEENQQRAKNEALVGNITGKTQGLLDVESVMKTAVREIGSSLGLTRVQITLKPDEPEPTGSNGGLELLE